MKEEIEDIIILILKALFIFLVLSSFSFSYVMLFKRIDHRESIELEINNLKNEIKYYKMIDSLKNEKF